MAGSGYYPGKPMFGGLAQGFEGAARSEAGSEQQAASYLGAQQNWQMEQQKLQLERLKEAMPLLQMQYRGEHPQPAAQRQHARRARNSGRRWEARRGRHRLPFMPQNNPPACTGAGTRWRAPHGRGGGEPLPGCTFSRPHRAGAAGNRTPSVSSRPTSSSRANNTTDQGDAGARSEPRSYTADAEQGRAAGDERPGR